MVHNNRGPGQTTGNIFPPQPARRVPHHGPTPVPHRPQAQYPLQQPLQARNNHGGNTPVLTPGSSSSSRHTQQTHHVGARVLGDGHQVPGDRRRN